MFEDIDGTLRMVHHLCGPSTRIIISYYSHLWEPVLKLAEALHLRSKQPKINYIATADFLNLMDLRVHWAPGIPCALYFRRGETVFANLGPIAPRDRGVVPGLRRIYTAAPFG